MRRANLQLIEVGAIGGGDCSVLCPIDSPTPISTSMYTSNTSAHCSRFSSRMAAAAALLFASFTSVAQTPPGHLQAHLPVKPLQIVNLAATRSTGFTLRAHNVGRKCVELFEYTTAGDTISRGLLGPDATVTLTFGAASGVYVQNPGKRAFVRNPIPRRAVFEFEIINGTAPELQAQFVHQVAGR
jgi:hypothetical protein